MVRKGEKGERLIQRHYVQAGHDPYEGINFVEREAKITDAKGNIKFQAKGLTFPDTWSDNAVNQVADKYLRKADIPGMIKETDVRQLIGRVVYGVTEYGKANKYFADDEEANAFSDELTYILVTQIGSFNSPVWFNAGLFQKHGVKKKEAGFFFYNPQTKKIESSTDAYEHPLCSACFILGIEDSLLEGPDSIYHCYEDEGRLFSYGAGSGINRSKLRGKGEKLSGGGRSSGALSFLEMACQSAGTVKSGGRSRRAAKLECLNEDHPEIVDFIRAKATAEIDARRMIAAGADPAEAYAKIANQNANLSVRVTDKLMKKAFEGGTVKLTERKTGDVIAEYPAEELFVQMAACAWASGDPGMQFHTRINEWNTVANSGEINCSNPCSEFMFLDNSACNLASINLGKVYDGTNIDIEGFRQTIKVLTTAQEIIVDYAGYPKRSVAQNSHDHRPLGLGFANLGSTLMRAGLPYDSDEARNVAQAITAFMTGEAYSQSIRLAARVGAFEKFSENRAPFVRVMEKHKEVADLMRATTNAVGNLEEFVGEVKKSWKYVVTNAGNGARNAQTTVIAPTGTIGFMMDCDTTGVEPGYSLIIYKQTIEGGEIKIVNSALPFALEKLGYSHDQIRDVVHYVDEHGHVVKAPHVKEAHYPVFDCAMAAGEGERCLSYSSHIRMCSAVQPLISGAISKTVNLPSDATVMDMMEAYREAWQRGMKSVSVYRDGAKKLQPLRTKQINGEVVMKRGQKEDLPAVRNGVVIETKLILDSGLEQNLHMITGEDKYGNLKEIRLQMTKGGTGLQSLLDFAAVTTSVALRSGTSLRELVTKNVGTKTPDFTGRSDHEYAFSFTSLPDFIYTVLGVEYMGEEFFEAVPAKEGMKERVDLYSIRKNVNARRLVFEENMGEIREIQKVMSLKSIEDVRKYEEDKAKKEGKAGKKKKKVLSASGALCGCGGMQVQDGACMKCINCGKTSGCAW